jgi:hypothetical protein
MTKRRLSSLEAALLSRLLPRLPSCQRLSTLLLNDNLFNFRAMDVLLESLQQLPALRTLDLSGTRQLSSRGGRSRVHEGRDVHALIDLVNGQMGVEIPLITC